MKERYIYIGYKIQKSKSEDCWKESIDGRIKRNLLDSPSTFPFFLLPQKNRLNYLLEKISQRRRARNDSLLTDIRGNGTKRREGIVAGQRIRGQSKLHFDLCIRASSKTGFPRPIKDIFEAQPSDFTDPWPINLVYLGGLSSLLYRGPALVPVPENLAPL